MEENREIKMERKVGNKVYIFSLKVPINDDYEDIANDEETKIKVLGLY